jgi:hypothetical protein
MGIVTFVTWIFNFTLAITWPTFEKEFGLSLSFVWYGVWCVIGFFLVLM